MTNRDPKLDTPEAADYLGLKPRTMEKLRIVGGGPRYQKLGRRVKYPVSELDRWAAARLRSSTSDTGSAGA